MADHRIGFATSVAAFAALLFASACGGDRIAMSSRGSWASTGGVTIMGGAGVWETGKPAVLFGLAQGQGAAPRLTYLVLCEHSATIEGAWSTRENRTTSNDGRIAKSGHTFGVGDLEFDAAVRLEWNGQGRVVGESLRFDGRDVDPADGRVFLVDLRGKESRVLQIAADLPAPLLPEEEGEAAVEAYSAEVVEILRSRGDVREFFDSAR